MEWLPWCPAFSIVNSTLTRSHFHCLWANPSRWNELCLFRPVCHQLPLRCTISMLLLETVVFVWMQVCSQVVFHPCRKAVWSYPFGNEPLSSIQHHSSAKEGNGWGFTLQWQEAHCYPLQRTPVYGRRHAVQRYANLLLDERAPEHTLYGYYGWYWPDADVAKVTMEWHRRWLGTLT